MLNRSKFLFVHGTTAEAWAKTHGIEPFSAPCGDCGAPLTTSLPFAYRQLRGLAAPSCACGNTLTPYGVVRAARFGDLLSSALNT